MSSTPSGTGDEKEDPKPACAARNIVAPQGMTAVHARVDRTGKRVAYSVTREIPGSPPKIVWDIYDEPTCGGTPTLLASNVRSLSFAFDDQNRLVYFAEVTIPGLLVPQLVARAAGGQPTPFLGGCTVSNDQKLFVDVSADGKRALISRQQSDGYEAIHYIGSNGKACGETFTSSSGPFHDTWSYFFGATRLSWDGKRSLRAPQGDNACVIGTGDHSNDLRIYDFATKQGARAAATMECMTMDAVAWLPDNKRFLVYYAGSISLGEAGGTKPPVKIADAPQGQHWLDVSADGAYYTLGTRLAPMPKLP